MESQSRTRYHAMWDDEEEWNPVGSLPICGGRDREGIGLGEGLGGEEEGETVIRM